MRVGNCKLVVILPFKVLVGHEKLIGEVIRIRDDESIIRVYDDPSINHNSRH